MSCLRLRQNIHLSERVGDLSTQYEPSKLFKPVTDMQKDVKEGLVSELKPIREGMKNLPTAGAGKVSLDKISWFMPHVIPADAEKFSIYKTIESKVNLQVAYRTIQCVMLSVTESTSFI